MHQHEAQINMATGEYTDIDTGKTFPCGGEWRKWRMSIAKHDWQEINRQADPADETEYNLPLKVSRYDLRYQCYAKDELINNPTRTTCR